MPEVEQAKERKKSLKDTWSGQRRSLLSGSDPEEWAPLRQERKRGEKKNEEERERRENASSVHSSMGLGEVTYTSGGSRQEIIRIEMPRRYRVGHFVTQKGK